MLLPLALLGLESLAAKSGLACLPIPPSQSSELTMEALRDSRTAEALGDAAGTRAPCSSLQEFPIHSPPEPCHGTKLRCATGQTNRCGMETRALTGHPASMTNTAEAGKGEQQPLLVSEGTVQLSGAEHTAVTTTSALCSSLLTQRSACNNSPVPSPVGKPPLLAHPPFSNELSLQKKKKKNPHQNNSICNIVINRVPAHSLDHCLALHSSWL